MATNVNLQPLHFVFESKLAFLYCLLLFSLVCLPEKKKREAHSFWSDCLFCGFHFVKCENHKHLWHGNVWRVLRDVCWVKKITRCKGWDTGTNMYFDSEPNFLFQPQQVKSFVWLQYSYSPQYISIKSFSRTHQQNYSMLSIWHMTKKNGTSDVLSPLIVWLQ